jgi:hypothetical protein
MLTINKLQLSTLAFIVGIVPVIVININYLIAASEGSVPWCNPYWDGCTSISATGRHGIAFVFFKVTMLPVAGLYALYWRQIHRQLCHEGYLDKTVLRLGYLSVAALCLYIVTLGLVGDSFQLGRRIGIIFYFTFTYLCQLLTIYHIKKLQIHLVGLTLQLQLSLLILGIGVLTLVLGIVLENYNDYEDAFEWNIALLLHLGFLLNWWGWRQRQGVI